MVENNDAGSEITCTTAGDYYQWITMDSTASTDGSQGITYDHANHRMTVVTAGRYHITVAVAISCDAASEVHMGLFKNGSGGTYGVNHFDVKFANDNVPMCITQFGNYTVGNYLDIRFSTDNNGDKVSAYHAVACMVYIGASN